MPKKMPMKMDKDEAGPVKNEKDEAAAGLMIIEKDEAGAVPMKIEKGEAVPMKRKKSTGRPQRIVKLKVAGARPPKIEKDKPGCSNIEKIVEAGPSNIEKSGAADDVSAKAKMGPMPPAFPPPKAVALCIYT